MVIDRPQAKQAARNLMRTARVSPYQIGLIYVIIVFALSAFEQTMLQLFGIPYYLSYSYYSTVLMPSPINWFITILVWLISIVLAAGFATYCLAIRRGKEMPLSTLFDGFSIAGKVILLEIVAGIFIFLWSLLLIIPGIIATYRYRFALYNLLENPDLGILEAINLSKEQTYGYKWQLFVLDLSFLGAAEVDCHGNVNVSKFGTRCTGPGGFVNISQNTKRVFFTGTFTAGGLKEEVRDGRLVILQEGRSKKFRRQVEQITFSGDYAVKSGQDVTFLTERAVLKLTPDGLMLTEIAPGVELEQDILAQMEFRPLISPELREMDHRIFQAGPMGLTL